MACMTASKSQHQGVIVNLDEEQSAIQKAMEWNRSYVLTQFKGLSSEQKLDLLIERTAGMAAVVTMHSDALKKAFLDMKEAHDLSTQTASIHQVSNRSFSKRLEGIERELIAMNETVSALVSDLE